MSEELENALRAALKPVDPGERFTREVLSRVAVEPRARARVHLWAQPAWLALAASVLLALTGAALWRAHRVQEGQEARLQLLQALRVTERQLDGAYRAVNAPRPLSRDSGT